MQIEPSSPQPTDHGGSEWPAVAGANGPLSAGITPTVDFSDLSAWFAAPTPALGSTATDHFGLHALLAPGANSAAFAGASGNPSAAQSPAASGLSHHPQPHVGGAELQSLFSDDLGALEPMGWAARNGQLH